MSGVPGVPNVDLGLGVPGTPPSCPDVDLTIPLFEEDELVTASKLEAVIRAVVRDEMNHAIEALRARLAWNDPFTYAPVSGRASPDFSGARTERQR